jgi:ABC-2 type transport system ATP-binding protein
MSMQKLVLEVKNLTKCFGNFTAVDNVSFGIKEGEIVGLLGPNGAGKTTTIQMLLALTSPSSGSISYFGMPLHKEREKILKRINHCSGLSRLPWKLTVWENINVYGHIYEVKNHKKRICELGELFEASHLFNKHTEELSAGETTRVLLIKAFLNNPDILLLDEPTSSLDPDIATKIRSLIIEERKKRKLSILITSHNMDEIEEICDRVIFFHQGKIIASDTPQKLAKRLKESKLHLMVPANKENSLYELAVQHNYPYEKKKNFIVIMLPEIEVAQFLMQISKKEIEYSEIEIVHPSLEDFFLTLSKKGKKT